MNRPSGSQLLLTDRALRDIQDIAQYSSRRWGKRTSEKYLTELEEGMQRIKEHPNLLKPEPEFHSSLMFYRVNKHLLVCDVHVNSIIVLTVIHSGMEIANRLAELQPTLATEIEILHQRLRSS